MDATFKIRAVKLKQWAEMIHTCRSSGQTVCSWCAENGINIKTYYYRLKQVRSEALKNIPAEIELLPVQAKEIPAFAEVTLSRNNLPQMSSKSPDAPAATITIGELTINIHNKAEADIVASVMKAASEIANGESLR